MCLTAQPFIQFIFILSIFLLQNAVSQIPNQNQTYGKWEEPRNINPDPHGEPWIVGILRAITQEEIDQSSLYVDGWGI